MRPATDRQTGRQRYVHSLLMYHEILRLCVVPYSQYHQCAKCSDEKDLQITIIFTISCISGVFQRHSQLASGPVELTWRISWPIATSNMQPATARASSRSRRALAATATASSFSLRAASRSDSAAAARSRSIPTGAYNQQRVSTRQHTSAYVSIAYVSIRQHTSRQHTSAYAS